MLCLATLRNGDVIAGGTFTSIDGIAANRVARWNGTTWSAMGTGMDNAVSNLTPLGQSGLIATGQFSLAGGWQVNHIARWDGAAWQPTNPLFTNMPGPVATLPSGDVLVITDNTLAGHIPQVLDWDGVSTFTMLGPGVTGGSAYAAAVLANGDIVVGGNFTSAGGRPSAYFGRFGYPSADFNHDGDIGTDQDIDAFFACLAGNCCPLCSSADFNNDGDVGTDADIESFFRVLAGGPC